MNDRDGNCLVKVKSRTERREKGRRRFKAGNLITWLKL